MFVISNSIGRVFLELHKIIFLWPWFDTHIWWYCIAIVVSSVILKLYFLRFQFYFIIIVMVSPVSYTYLTMATIWNNSLLFTYEVKFLLFDHRQQADDHNNQDDDYHKCNHKQCNEDNEKKIVVAAVTARWFWHHHNENINMISCLVSIHTFT